MLQAVEQDENRHCAQSLVEVADLLEQQNASTFRIAAYRSAADYITHSAPPLRTVYTKAGLSGLQALPTIGVSIAKSIAEILDTGSLGLLARLRGAMDPEKLFQTVPKIGPHIARQLHDELHLETLEALEAAALDGRLGKLKGIGPRRVRSIENSLAKILDRRRPVQRHDVRWAPPVKLLLDVDRVYRSKAARGLLVTLSPKRFNTSGDNRIPILHTEIDNWHFTALFSNSPNAHRFRRERDWVVIYFENDAHGEGQCTVVTEHKGPLSGKRVVRGLETECARLYEAVRAKV